MGTSHAETRHPVALTPGERPAPVETESFVPNRCRIKRPRDRAGRHSRTAPVNLGNSRFGGTASPIAG